MEIRLIIYIYIYIYIFTHAQLCKYNVDLYKLNFNLDRSSSAFITINAVVVVVCLKVKSTILMASMAVVKEPDTRLTVTCVVRTDCMSCLKVCYPVICSAAQARESVSILISLEFTDVGKYSTTR